MMKIMEVVEDLGRPVRRNQGPVYASGDITQNALIADSGDGEQLELQGTVWAAETLELCASLVLCASQL